MPANPRKQGDERIRTAVVVKPANSSAFVTGCGLRQVALAGLAIGLAVLAPTAVLTAAACPVVWKTGWRTGWWLGGLR